MEKVKRLLFIAALFGAGCIGVTAANDVSELAVVGSVTGRITDAEHRVLPGATIMIEELHTGVTSDMNGFYKLPNLKPGTYEVKISYVGFQPIVAKIVIEGNKSKESNFVLTEGIALQEVVVDGAFSGQRRAMQMQKNSMGITNIVSADQVGKFPDSNIGDALKRINGINVQYDQGEARFGQVRGTSADLTSVTVNGNRLPSAEGDTRNVQLDLIPSDMVQTIEVNKVVTEDMDGDAIGGAINLVTKNTPSRRVLNFTVGTGHTWISDKQQWNFGATWGDRFFNDRLGVMASASYQYAPGGSDNTEFEYEMGNDGVELKEAQARQYYVTRERQSYSLALDYKFNPLNKISFKGIYNRRNDWENRYRISYKKLNSSASKQSVVLETKAGAYDTKNARLERQQTMDFTLDGDHYIGNLKIDWAGSYSRATEERPNERYASFEYEGIDFGSGFKDVFGRHPYCTVPLPDLDDDGWSIDELTNQDEDIVENEYKARLNFELPLVSGLYGNKLKFGAKYTSKDKKRDVSFYEYDEELLGNWRTQTYPQIRSGFMPGEFYPLHTPFIRKEFLGGIAFDKSYGEEVLEEEAGNYKVKESILAGYIRFDQKLGKKGDLMLGLRLENTHVKYSGSQFDADEEKTTRTPYESDSYLNVLPSVLVKYDVNDDFKVRASFTNTIARPKYSALAPNITIKRSDNEISLGNPGLKPTLSYNFDLSGEYYFKSIGLVSAGIFYKKINDFIVDQTLRNYSYNGTTYTKFSQPRNSGNADLLGVEVAYQRDFSFIAPSLKCIGFYGTYTYSYSRVDNFNFEGRENESSLRLPGSPEHTANASLFFEKSGLSIRLSYNYASAFIDEMGSEKFYDRYYDAVNYMDANASYTFGKKLKTTFYAEANNLLNQPLRYYQGTKDRTMQSEHYGIKVNAGVKINF